MAGIRHRQRLRVNLAFSTWRCLIGTVDAGEILDPSFPGPPGTSPLGHVARKPASVAFITKHLVIALVHPPHQPMGRNLAEITGELRVTRLRAVEVGQHHRVTQLLADQPKIRHIAVPARRGWPPRFKSEVRSGTLTSAVQSFVHV